MGLRLPAVGSRALSRHTGATESLFAVQAHNLNASCMLPGSPFSDELLLVPNHPGEDPPTVTFGPIEGQEINALTCLFVSPGEPEHSNRIKVRVQVLGSRAELLAESWLALSHGEHGPLTLRFTPTGEGGIRLRFETSFDRFEIGSPCGSIRMRYLAAFSDNLLVRLCNAAGSDKGSETYWGDGFPHLYALAYEALLSPFRDQRFNFLEIGLDTAGQASGQPTDAPSLRVWREFFPHATLYGYDLNDFEFFEQRGTHVFQGDQSSRDDIRRFLEVAGMPRFRVVIDDGSHVPSHQQVSLAALFDRVEPSGIYVIEDLDWQPHEESPTTRQVLAGLAEHGRLESPFISASDSRRLEARIARVEFYRPNDFEFAVITRKPARLRRRVR